MPLLIYLSLLSGLFVSQRPSGDAPTLLSNVEATKNDSTLILRTTICLYNTTSDTLFYFKKVMQDFGRSNWELVYEDWGRYTLAKERNVYAPERLWHHGFECDSIILIPPGSQLFLFDLTMFNIVGISKKKQLELAFRDDFLQGGSLANTEKLVSSARKNALTTISSAKILYVKYRLRLDGLSGIKTENVIENYIN